MKTNQHGFTLIELLISITIALIISAAIFGIYANSAGSSAAMLKSSKLNQELYALMLVMSNDIRRAGYVAAPDPAAGPDAYEDFFKNPQKNPFSQDDTELGLIDSYTTNGPVTADSATEAKCVLYTFDQNESGALEQEEIFGFRLKDNVVEMRVGWNDYDPSADTINKDCTSGNWEAVTDDKLIKIQKLGFWRIESQCINAVDTSNPNCYSDPPAPGSKDTTVETRQIKIRLEGSLVNDPSVIAAIEQNVRVRNDRVKEY